MKRFLLLFFCLGSSLSAQWVPTLFIEGEKETRDQLRVEQLDAKVVIIGNVAETSLTMRFRNDTNRVLEGEFVCPLNEGQTVSGYSLEIGDEMRAGVAVEKQQARQIFEDIVRQNIDPGLAELTKGNNFRTRVYPIPARGTKRVGVTFREVLPRDGDDLRYRLPLDFKKSLSRFSISIVAPHAVGDLEEVEDLSSGLTLKQTAKRGWRLGSIRKNYTPKGPLEVRIPIRREPMVSTGRGPSGKRYFHVTDRVLRPVDEAPVQEPVKSIQLVWDASGSGGLRDRDKELALLREVLGSHPGATVRLSLLRHEVEELGSFTDIESLIQELEQVIYDGGTDPGRLNLFQVKEDLVLLVTDGIGTLGTGKITSGDIPIHIFHAAPSGEYEGLKHLARSTGGRYVNLNTVSLEEALTKLTKPVFQLLSAEGADGMMPGGPIPVTPDGLVDFSGQLEGSELVTLKLGYGFSGKVITTQEVTIDPEIDALEGKHVASLWASHQLAALMGDPKKNRKEITKLGREFGLVTPYTSLLVLDRIEDYVEHRVVPPTAKLRKEYDRLVKLEETKVKVGNTHLDDLFVRWKALGEWHDKDFDPIDILLYHRLIKDRKKIGELLKRRIFSNARRLTKEEREELTQVDLKLAALQTELAQFGKIPRNQRRKVISDYASRYSKMRKKLYRESRSISNMVTAGLRSGSSAIIRNSIDGILNRPSPQRDGAPTAPAFVPMMPMVPVDESSSESATITLAKWDPKTPYLQDL